MMPIGLKMGSRERSSEQVRSFHNEASISKTFHVAMNHQNHARPVLILRQWYSSFLFALLLASHVSLVDSFRYVIVGCDPQFFNCCILTVAFSFLEQPPILKTVKSQCQRATPIIKTTIIRGPFFGIFLFFCLRSYHLLGIQTTFQPQ
jgi:hypothetical protein